MTQRLTVGAVLEEDYRETFWAADPIVWLLTKLSLILCFG